MTITINPDVRNTVQMIPRDLIWLEPEAVQQRVALDAATVEEYTALYQEGRDLGPLVVFREHEVYILADGFHRFEAACFANVTTLPAVVYEGTLRDAIFYATSCNLHGKPLTNADKRKRVLTLLQDPEWQQWSDNAIAKHCGVTHPFVGAVRKSLVTVSSDESEQAQTSRTYQDKYGHVHTMDTSKIGQKASVATCGICGRPLSDPASVSAGIGPVCAGHSNGAHGGGGGGVAPSTAAAPLALAPEEPNPPDDETPLAWPQSVASGDFEWYTPPEILALVREVLGTIDVDPASCAVAQATVQATTYYTLEDDGLRQPWQGAVFCNPPYKLPEVARFCGKLIEERDAGRLTAAILLVNAATETEWFQWIAPYASAICFPKGRVYFTHPTRQAESPCAGSAVLYFGDDGERFTRVFAPVGLVCMERLPDIECAPEQLPLAAATPPADPGPEEPPSSRETTGSLTEAVWQMVQEHPGATKEEVAQILGAKPGYTLRALKTLIKHGRVRENGDGYWGVDVLEEIPA